MGVTLAVYGEFPFKHYKLSLYSVNIPASNCGTNEQVGENSSISLISILVYMLSAPVGLCSIPFMYIADLCPPEVTAHLNKSRHKTQTISRSGV